MPKGTNQKLKLYYLSRIMTEKTDDEHFIINLLHHLKKLINTVGNLCALYPVLRVTAHDDIGPVLKGKTAGEGG